MKDFFVVILFMGLALIMALGWSYENHDLEKFRYEAIERGYAEYCPKTGVLNWKGECE